MGGMKRLIVICFTSLVFFLSLSGQSWQESLTQVFALTHITVIDATGSTAKPDMTVVIAGNLISDIGKTGKVAIPKRALVINAANKFLIPGLWDMHVHNACNIRWGKTIFLPLYIAN